MNLVRGLHRAKVLPLQETLQLGFIFIWLYLVSLESISFHPPLLNPALKYNTKTLLKNSQDFSQVLPGLGEKKILEDFFFFHVCPLALHGTSHAMTIPADKHPPGKITVPN